MTVQPGLPAYGNLEGLPDLVAKAVQASRTVGYDKACIPEVGRLLHLLVSARRSARIGETGTACGVGAAWIASGMDQDSTLVTAELDPERAAIATRLFSQTQNVKTLCGDWSLIKVHGPFDILFVDGGPAKSECDEIMSMVARRGLIVFDDLTPPHVWTEEQRRAYADGDPVRNAWRDRPGCAACEVMVTVNASVLLVSRAG